VRYSKAWWISQWTTYLWSL